LFGIYGAKQQPYSTEFRTGIFPSNSVAIPDYFCCINVSDKKKNDQEITPNAPVLSEELEDATFEEPPLPPDVFRHPKNSI
ncbi:hypothetical protein HHI36_009741, partial [Cryptolaemus montrouzieri]